VIHRFIIAVVNFETRPIVRHTRFQTQFVAFSS
jgi:hypothetical protein